MKPYYYVYKHGDNGPRVRHSTLKIAQDEAERLAAKEPGRCFEILQCVGYSSTSKASTFWMDGEEPEEKPRYRMMAVGEIFEHGDEFLSNGFKWCKRDHGFGESMQRGHLPHRRPL